MKIFFAILLLFISYDLLAASKKLPKGELKLSIERIYSPPNLSGAWPRAVEFSPDGKIVTFLQEKKDKYKVLDLWSIDLQSGKKELLVDSDQLLKDSKEKLSQEEIARRERMRISSKGIVQYYWIKDGSGLIFPIGGELYQYTLKTKSLKQLTRNDEFETDLQISPKSTFITYLRKKGLYKLDLKTGKEKLLLKHPSQLIRYAIAEFVAQEEMNRFTGYWISENERYIAFTRVDESKVQVFDRYDIDQDKVRVFQQRYPKAGTANALVRLKILDLKTMKQTEVKIQDFNDYYLPRVKWSKDSKSLFYQVQNRKQTKLLMFKMQLSNKKQSLVLQEESQTWVNLHNDFKTLKNGNFIWKSEKSGFPHLYLHKPDGTLIRQITEGKWAVDGIVSVDQEKEELFFLGNREHPTERHLYKVSFAKKSEPSRLTNESGFHRAFMGKNKSRYYLISNHISRPERHELRAIDGKRIQTIVANDTTKADHPIHPFIKHFSQWNFESFKNKIGVELHYGILKPKNFDSSKIYPVIFSVYGGPLVQVATKSWKGTWGLMHQLLANQGYIVVISDNRGSPRRGKAFEDAIHLKMGSIEVEDQVSIVKHLSKNLWFDEKRVGILGWSYGGYLSIMACLKAPKTFKSCVATAPVTDWTLYDTHYTERYMGHPEENKEGYSRGNAMNFAKNLQGRLLLIHGMADDNVIFTHSTLFTKELQKQKKIFESMFYPGARHGIRGLENKIHHTEMVFDFFNRNL